MLLSAGSRAMLCDSMISHDSVMNLQHNVHLSKSTTPIGSLRAKARIGKPALRREQATPERCIPTSRRAEQNSEVP
jgi:hypothetical protein